MERTIERFAPLAGIAFAVLLFASVAGQGAPPVVGDPVGDVVEFYGDNTALLIVPVEAVTLTGLVLAALWVVASGVLLFREPVAAE